MKKESFSAAPALFAAIALSLAALAQSCCREVLPEDAHHSGGTVSFMLEEAVPDIRTKATCTEPAPESVSSTIVLTAPSGRTIELALTQEALSASSYTPATKAEAIYGNSWGDELSEARPSIAVWAYNYSGGSKPSSWIANAANRTGSAVEAPYNKTHGLWRPEPMIFFTPENLVNEKMRFFSVAPYKVLSGTSAPAVPTISSNQAPKLRYTVPSGSSAKHFDLLAAAPAERAFEVQTVLSMHYHHVLTALRFKTEDGLKDELTSITLSGIYGAATLDMTLIPQDGNTSISSVDKDKLWTDRVLSPESYTSGDSSWDLMDTSLSSVNATNIMMVIPQLVPQGATLTAKFGDEEYTGDISGQEWVPGKMVSYRIVRGKDIHFDIMPINECVLSPDGSEAQLLELNSYVLSDGTETPISWKVAGIYSSQALAEAGGTPDRLSWTAKPFTTSDGATSGSAGEKILVRAPSGVSTPYNINVFLSNSSLLGGVGSRVNLSNPENPLGNDFIAESANCYIINNPGYYRLPLVVGNGVKNGEANTASYSYNGATNFVDYTNNPIINPYLHKTSSGAGTPTSVSIVWTETESMLEGMSISSTGSGDSEVYWLNFNILPQNIKQGCTVIAVKDQDGVTMWSWLLWVTDYKPVTARPEVDLDVECTYSSSGDKATFMPRNLGWVVEGTVRPPTPAEDAWLRIEADKSFVVVKVTRATYYGEVPNMGHGPLFQWGRKDALRRDNPEFVITVADSGDKSISSLIRNPGAHFKENLYPFSTGGGQLYQRNLWSASATGSGQDTKTVKTVYDPCPAGYTVPRHNAFNGFTTSYSSWDSVNFGYTFNTGYQQKGKKNVFFPAHGDRTANGVNGNDSYGLYWTAVPQGDNTARRLSFTNGSIYLPSGTSATGLARGFYNKAGEHAVRPAREE